MINEKEIKNYYNYLKRKKRLECEIEILENNIERMKSYSSNDKNILSRIEVSKRRILNKSVELDDILQKIIEIDLIIKELNQTDQNILEMRFKKKLDYKLIMYNLNMSRSTVTRRINKIFNDINKELEDCTYVSKSLFINQ